MKLNMNKNISLLTVGNFISQCGTQVFNVALTWWLVSITGSDKFIGYVLASSMLPAVVLGPLGGLICDRYNKKIILVVSDLLSGLLSTLIAFMVYNNVHNIYVLVMCTFLLGVCTTLFKPTFKSIIPDISNSEQLKTANSLVSSSSSLTKVIGPSLASLALLTPFIGIVGAFLINGLSFIASAVFECFLTYHNSVTEKKISIYEDIKQGFNYTLRNRFVRDVLLTATAANMFLTSIYIVLPLYINKELLKPVDWYSYSLTAEALGGIIISVVFTKTKFQADRKLMFLLLILLGCSIFCIQFSSASYLIYLCMFCAGVFQVGLDITFYTYLQSYLDRVKLGRVFSILFMFSTLGMGISYLVFGTIASYFLNIIFCILGVGIMISAAPLLLSERSVQFKRSTSL